MDTWLEELVIASRQKRRISVASHSQIFSFSVSVSTVCFLLAVAILVLCNTKKRSDN